MSILFAPFRVLKAPKVRLRFPRQETITPPRWLVMTGVIMSYLMVLSGIIYDVIIEPPSVGSVPDGHGNYRPQAFMEGRVNGQYIVEGLSAGTMIGLGALGLILLDKGKELRDAGHWIIVIIGCALSLMSYNILMLFLSKKVHNLHQG
jgi:oligosaccharyltransferase complex subunit OSTC